MFQDKIPESGLLLPQAKCLNEGNALISEEDLISMKKEKLWRERSFWGLDLFSENLLLFFVCHSWAEDQNFKNISARWPSEYVEWKLRFKWFFSFSFPPLSLLFHSSFSPPSSLFPSCLPCFLSLPLIVASHCGVFEQHGNTSSKAASSEAVLRSFSQLVPWNQRVPVHCLLTVADSLLIKKGQHI